MHLTINYEEVVYTDVMHYGVGMVIDRGRGPKMFLEPFPKGHCRFSYTLLITIQSLVLVSGDYSAFLSDVVPILWDQHKVPDGLASFEMDLDSLFATNVFELVVMWFYINN